MSFFVDCKQLKQLYKLLQKTQPSSSSATNCFSQLERSDTHELSLIVAYIRDDYMLKKGFQRFLNQKLRLNGIEKIDLDDLETTCETTEKQTILLISLLYYFI